MSSKVMHIFILKVFSNRLLFGETSSVICTCVGGIYVNIVHMKSLVVEFKFWAKLRIWSWFDSLFCFSQHVQLLCAACWMRSEGRTGDHDKEQMWQLAGRKHFNFPPHHLKWSEINHVVWCYINNRIVFEAWLVDISFMVGRGMCFTSSLFSSLHRWLSFFTA